MSVWIPIVLPVGVAVAVNGLGVRMTEPPLSKIVQVMLISLIYGGVPYLLVALWATWWIRQRTESEIRRRALSAPLWMIAVWSVFALIPTIASRKIEMFFGLVGLGAVYSIALGYAYVALVLGLRALLGRVGVVRQTAGAG